jgi:hypothetical protein
MRPYSGEFNVSYERHFFSSVMVVKDYFRSLRNEYAERKLALPGSS